MPSIGELIELIGVLGGALAAIILAFRKLLDTLRCDETARLKEELVHERATKEKLQTALDESASQVEQLIDKLRGIQNEMTQQAVKDIEDSHAQLAQMQEIIKQLEDGRLANGEAIAALRKELNQLRLLVKQLTDRNSYLISENMDLAKELIALDYQGNFNLTLADIQEIKGRLQNGSNFEQRKYYGPGGLAADPVGDLSRSGSQALLSASG